MIPGLKAALGERPVLTEQDIADMVGTGEAREWPLPSGGILVRQIPYDSGEVVLHGGPAGGDREEIIGAIPRIEEWARGNGVTQIHVHMGREGWRKDFAAMGYEVYQVIMRKVIA
jgi:hypothetical protein